MGCGNSKPSQVAPSVEVPVPETPATSNQQVPETKAVETPAKEPDQAPEETPVEPIAREPSPKSPEEAPKSSEVPKIVKCIPSPSGSCDLASDVDLSGSDENMAEKRASGLGKKYKDVKLQWAFRPLIFVGVSGSGKRTLAAMFVDENPDQFGFSVSHTTRDMRPGETEASYHFVSEEVMETMRENGEFLQVTKAYGSVYGTSFKEVQAVAHRGQMCVMAMEIEGAIELKKSEDFQAFRPRYILIRPPSLKDLVERLKLRGDSEDRINQMVTRASQVTSDRATMQKKFSVADMDTDADLGEFRYGTEEDDEDFFDAVVINRSIQESYKTLKNILTPDFGLKCTTTVSRASLAAALMEDQPSNE